MRNLAEHPITTEEIVDCLERMHNEIVVDIKAQGRFGDLRPRILQEAILIIKQHEKETAHV